MREHERNVLHVHPLLSAPHETRVRLSGNFGSHDVWIRSDAPMAEDMTAWMLFTLPIAMATGQNLKIHGAVDSASLVNALRAQEVLSRWFSTRRRSGPSQTLSRVKVQVDEVLTGQPPPVDGNVVLFSGGVDAFHSALRNPSSHLLFVHGFDVPWRRSGFLEEVGFQLRLAAEDMGRELVQASTNIRDISDRLLDWGFHYHGAAISAIAVAHPGLWGTATIASSRVEKHLRPWGSHPALDRLWSSSRVTIEHDSVEWTRAQKVSEIADWPVAMRHLRVCYQNVEGAYNCCRCEKCIRTMLALHGLSRLDGAVTFPRRLDLDDVRGMSLRPSQRVFARENLALLREHGKDDMADALQSALLRSVRTQITGAVPKPLKRALRRLSPRT